jgi:hypothetical protein
VGVWQKTLQPPAEPPAPVVPFAVLRDSPALETLLAREP